MAIGDDFWNNLTEDEKAQVASTFGMTGPTALDYGFEEEDPFSFTYGGGMAGMGVQPSVDYFTTKDKVNLGDLGQEAKRVNLLQDYGSLSVDNILTGYAGGGAYDTDAFTPTYDYGTPVNMKGRRKAESLSGAGGWQGFVTDLIFNEGLSPAEAEAKLYETINAPDDPTLSDQERSMKEALVQSMPPSMADGGATPPSGGRSAAGKARDPWDSETIRTFTTNIWSDLMEDPDFAYQDPETGQYYDKTPEQAMVKTPQMMAFDKFGVPYPTATYDDPQYQEEFTSMAAGGAGPEQREAQYGGWQEQQDALTKEFQRARQGEVRSDRAADSLEGAWAKAQANARPMTEWDAILDAQRAGGDQQAARDQFNQAYGPNRQGQGPLAPQPKAPTFDELLSAGGQPGGGFDFLGGQAQAQPAAPAASQFDFFGAKPPMVVDGPLSGIGRSGDRVLTGDPQLRRNSPWDFGAALLGRQGKIPEVRRTKEEDVTKQRGKAKQATTKRSQKANQVFQQTYQDPRLATVEALGRAYALRQAGQTPYLDAMSTRNANARRMLSGG